MQNWLFHLREHVIPMDFQLCPTELPPWPVGLAMKWCFGLRWGGYCCSQSIWAPFKPQCSHALPGNSMETHPSEAELAGSPYSQTWNPQWVGSLLTSSGLMVSKHQCIGWWGVRWPFHWSPALSLIYLLRDSFQALPLIRHWARFGGNNSDRHEPLPRVSRGPMCVCNQWYRKGGKPHSERTAFIWKWCMSWFKGIQIFKNPFWNEVI